jgi:hypothetical protein
MQIIEGLQQLVAAPVAWSDGPGWALAGLLIWVAVAAITVAWNRPR